MYDTGYGEAGYRDERCKYCNPDKSGKLVTRLARWLRWRDERIARPE